MHGKEKCPYCEYGWKQKKKIHRNGKKSKVKMCRECYLKGYSGLSKSGGNGCVPKHKAHFIIMEIKKRIEELEKKMNEVIDILKINVLVLRASDNLDKSGFELN